MQNEHTAFNGSGLNVAADHPSLGIVIDYPKSEPVLESSYIFPKADCYDNWKFDTSSAFTVSANI